MLGLKAIGFGVVGPSLFSLATHAYVMSTELLYEKFQTHFLVDKVPIDTHTIFLVKNKLSRVI